jgi:predicted nucleotide-binding protein
MEVFPGTPTATIITQGGADNDLFFILAGSVEISVNGRPVARRGAGTHVGEMALIDPTVRRSATVVACEPTVLIRINERDFTETAQRHPQLWRGIAVEISNRLRERNKYIRQPHNVPVVFIGSSSEQLDVARELQVGLSHDPCVVYVWTDGIFKASRVTIENLTRTVEASDFAVLVVSPDDLVESRGVEAYGPRDNVLLELGLFMGGIGRERTFLVKQRGVDIKIPSDLLGVTPLEFSAGDPSTLSARIAPVCTQLRKVLQEMGPK